MNELHGDEHIKMVDGLTKHQLFALNHYLQAYDQDMSFDDIVQDLFGYHDNSVPYDIYSNNLSSDEIANCIYEMAEDLEDTFK
jgi:hypothetical protein